MMRLSGSLLLRRGRGRPTAGDRSGRAPRGRHRAGDQCPYRQGIAHWYCGFMDAGDLQARVIHKNPAELRVTTPPRRLRRHARVVHLGAGPRLARRPAGRGAEHRARGGRSAPGPWSRRPCGAALPGQGLHHLGRHLRGAGCADLGVRARAARPRPGSRRPGLQPRRPRSVAVCRHDRDLQGALRILPPVQRVRARARAPAHRPRRRPGAGHLGRPVPQEGRAGPRGAPGPDPHPARRSARRGRLRHPRRDPSRGPRGRPADHVRHRAHGRGGARAAALHQRHHGHPQGRDARAWRGRGPPRHRAVRPRPAPRGHLLVHRRPGLGHGHVLRGDRAPDGRAHRPRGRGRVRRPPLVPHARRAVRHDLVHRTDGDPDAHAGRHRAARASTTCRRCGSSRAWGSR